MSTRHQTVNEIEGSSSIPLGFFTHIFVFKAFVEYQEKRLRGEHWLWDVDALSAQGQ